MLLLASKENWVSLQMTEVIAFITGGYCVWLCVVENIWNWPIGIVNSVAFLILFLHSRLFADAGLRAVYIVLGFWGWYWWLKGGKAKTKLKVSLIGLKECLVLLVIGHDQKTEDITYENTQARLRTSAILMNYANSVNGFVEGTGDLSETALGWCSFNGDHMSMFNPNSNVPKTLVRHLVHWYADHKATKPVRLVLEDILTTPISPELTGNGDLSQTTESIVGSYDLIDFSSYQLLRYGSRPSKIGYLASIAYGSRFSKNEQAWQLGEYLRRFTSGQWKRDVMSNGTKIGSVAVSPRGDLRMAPNTSPDWSK